MTFSLSITDAPSTGLFVWELRDQGLIAGGQAPTIDRCITEIARARLTIEHHVQSRNAHTPCPRSIPTRARTLRPSPRCIRPADTRSPHSSTSHPPRASTPTQPSYMTIAHPNPVDNLIRITEKSAPSRCLSLNSSAT